MSFIFSRSCKLPNVIHNQISKQFFVTISKAKVKERSSSLQLPEKKIKVQDKEINYAEFGDGPHVVLCLPGMFGTIQTDLEPVVLKFNQQRFKMVVWDPPGCGKSRKPGEIDREVCRRQRADAEIANHFMNQLGIQKYSVLGWSNGAVVGLHLITSNPDKIRRFISFGAPAFSDQYGMEMAKMMSDFNNWQPTILSQFLEIYGEKGFRTMVDGVKDFIMEGKFDVKPLLPKVQAPTLIIHGNKDINCSAQHARVYHNGIPNAKLELWPGASHYLHLEQTDKFVKTVERFLSEDTTSA